MTNLTVLFIVDQMRVFESSTLAATFRSKLPYQFEFASTIVQCGYVPAVTPVGHATISTGKSPANHGILGRKWKTGHGGRHGTGARTELAIDAITAAYETVGGPSRIQDPRNQRQITGTFPGVFCDILFDTNLCERLGDNTFKLVVSAKDFVSVLLGGFSADVLIYPCFLDTALPGRFIDCSIRIYSSPRLSMYLGSGVRGQGPFEGWVTPTIEKRIIAALSDLLDKVRIGGKPLDGLDELKKKIRNKGWDAAEGHHNFTLPFNFDILKEPKNNVAVDKMYTAIIEAFIHEYEHKVDRIAVLQSLYSADLTAHMYGIGQEYNDNIAELLSHVAITTTNLFKSSSHSDIHICVTSDHGGRDVSSESRVELLDNGDVYVGRCPIPVASATCDWYQEDMFVAFKRFPPASVPLASSRQPVVLIDGSDGLHYWQIPSTLLQESFHSQLPDVVIMPSADGIMLRPSNRHFGTKGAHGAGVTFVETWVGPKPPHPLIPDAIDPISLQLIGELPIIDSGWSLLPEEQFVPLFAASTKRNALTQSRAGDVKWLSEASTVFISLAQQ